MPNMSLLFTILELFFPSMIWLNTKEDSELMYLQSFLPQSSVGVMDSIHGKLCL